MKTQRRFRPEFKRQVIEELLSRVSSPAQIIRRYEISSGRLYHWKRQTREEYFRVMARIEGREQNGEGSPRKVPPVFEETQLLGSHDQNVCEYP